jgi:hypothetical protein
MFAEGGSTRWNDALGTGLTSGYVIEFEASNGAVPEASSVVIWSLLCAVGMGFVSYRRRVFRQWVFEVVD